MKQTVHNFDSRLTRWVVSTFGQSSRRFFEVMTTLGDPIAVTIMTVLVISLGMVQANPKLEVSGVIIPLTVLVGALLKLFFERARPMTEYALNMKLQTFSFPSGHSTGSMVTYGLLSLIASHIIISPWGIIGALMLAIIPFAVGLSRVYLGAHFPSDVIAGWLLGASALAVIVLIVRPFV